MTQKPLVSVVMAAFNADRFIANAIESALSQTFDSLELIVVDDGSTDSTRTVVQRYLSDRRVQYFSQPNAGQCAAKNKGIELTAAPFVAFLDADDRWLPGKLTRQLPLFDDRPDVGVVYGFLEKIDAEGRPVPWDPVTPHRGSVTSQLLLENFVPFASAVVRRSLLERHGGFDCNLDMGIDYDLWLRLSQQCEFDFVQEVVGQYRVWEGQMSRKVFQRYEAGIEIMREFLIANAEDIAERDVRRAWAHTFTGRANAHLWTDRSFVRAWRDFGRAIGYDATYWPTYRSMLRSLLTWRPP